MREIQFGTRMTIPKLIFQTWKTKDLPDQFQEWSSTFKDENPTYAYRLWDDADNLAFITKYFPWFLETYTSYPEEIFRVDAVRYFFLYQFGGIYADLDTECLLPLDSITRESGVILGRMGPNPSFEHSIPNALMASEPRHEFWLLVMSLLFDPQKITSDRPEYITGPVLLKTAYDLYLNSYREDIVQNRLANIRSKLTEKQKPSDNTSIMVTHGNTFFPLDWNDAVHEAFVLKPMRDENKRLSRETVLNLFPNSLTVSYWSHTWEQKQ